MLDVDRPGFAVPVAFPVRAVAERVPVRAVPLRAGVRAREVVVAVARAGAALRTDDGVTPPPAV